MICGRLEPDARAVTVHRRPIPGATDVRVRVCPHETGTLDHDQEECRRVFRARVEALVDGAAARGEKWVQ